jgi:hypothetical protein
MEADMWLAFVPVPQRVTPELLEELRQACYHLSPETEEELYYDYVLGEEPYDGRKSQHEAIACRLWEVIEALLTDPGREGYHILLHGVRYLCSGGLSWGDEPTELFSPICMANASGVLERFDDPVEVIRSVSKVLGANLSYSFPEGKCT